MSNVPATTISHEDKREAILNVLSGADPQFQCDSLGINRFVLNNWLNDFKKTKEYESMQASAFKLTQQTPQETITEAPKEKKMGRSNLPEKDRKEIARRRSEGETIASLAEEFGCSSASVTRWSAEFAPESEESESGSIDKAEMKFQGDYFVIKIPKKMLSRELLKGLL